MPEKKWTVRVDDHPEFTMISPQPLTQTEADEDVRARFPKANTVKVITGSSDASQTHEDLPRAGLSEADKESTVLRKTQRH